jgi:hypothetical protein
MRYAQLDKRNPVALNSSAIMVEFLIKRTSLTDVSKPGSGT